MKWQPIETAPKDGTILVFRGRGTRVEIAQWHDDRQSNPPKPYWLDSSLHGISWMRANPPTHWMPLPEFPED